LSTHFTKPELRALLDARKLVETDNTVDKIVITINDILSNRAKLAKDLPSASDNLTDIVITPTKNDIIDTIQSTPKNLTIQQKMYEAHQTIPKATHSKASRKSCHALVDGKEILYRSLATPLFPRLSQQKLP
jgi:hypothetical protein